LNDRYQKYFELQPYREIFGYGYGGGTKAKGRSFFKTGNKKFNLSVLHVEV